LDTISRTIRFKVQEVKLIEEFLEKNPFFDFSSLTRTAVNEFIRNPNLLIQGIDLPKSEKPNFAQESRGR
jgi:hypothetical protein